MTAEYVPTADQRSLVESAAAFGLTQAKPFFEGNIDTDDKWLRDYANKKRGDIARYLAEGAGVP
jgi:hypothetical protein